MQRIPYIAAVKGEMKNLYYQEKYRYCMAGRKIKFEKKIFFSNKCI